MRSSKQTIAIGLLTFSGFLIFAAAASRSLAEELSEQRISDLSNSVVKVQSTATYIGTRNASGFVWGARRQVVTAFHAVAALETPSITVYYKGHGSRLATVVAVDLDADLALLDVRDPPSDISSLELATEPTDEKSFTLIAYPSSAPADVDREVKRSSLGLHTIASLPVSLRSPIQDLKFPSTKLPVITLYGSVGPGDSGGPIFDTKGRVVGLVDGGLGQGIFWAVPADKIAGVADAKGPSPVNPEALRTITSFYSDFRALSLIADGHRRKLVVSNFSSVPDALMKDMSAGDLDALLRSATQSALFFDLTTTSPAVSTAVTVEPHLNRVDDRWILSAKVTDKATFREETISAEAAGSFSVLPNLVRELWAKVDTPPLVAALNQHAVVTKIEFNPNGDTILTFGDDRIARIWSTSTGEQLATIEHCQAVALGDFSVRFSRTGRYTVIRKDDASQVVWDIQAGHVVWTTTFPDETILSLDDGAEMALTEVSDAKDGKMILRRNLAEGSDATKFDVIHKDSLGYYSLEFSPDHSLFVVVPKRTVGHLVSAAANFELWKTDGDKRIARFDGSDPRFSETGKKLVASVGRETGIVDVNTTVEKLVKGKRVNFSNRDLVTIDGNEVRIFEIEAARQISHVTTTREANYAVLTEIGDLVADVVGDLEIYDAYSGQSKATFRGLGSGAIVSPNGRYVGMVSGARIVVYDAKHQTTIVDKTVGAKSDGFPINQIGFLGPQNTIYAAAREAGTIDIYSMGGDGSLRVITAEAFWNSYAPGVVIGQPDQKTVMSLVHSTPSDVSKDGNVLAIGKGEHTFLYFLN